MAALSSRPSLRSSSRNNPIFNEVPRTLADQNQNQNQNPLTNSRRGKHTRASSLENQSNISVKRLRLGHPDLTRSRHVSKTYVPKSLPIRDRSAAQDAATQAGKPRKPAPPRHINGTTTALHPVQSFNNHTTLTVNTTDLSSQNDKRSLRSHDGCSRSKSELALYFPNYDELVSIEPKEPGTTSNDPDPWNSIHY